MSADGVTLRALRETVGMSVERLATLAGVGERTVRRWERGMRPVPEDVMDIVTRAKERQDEVVSFAIAQYEAAYDLVPDDVECPVELRYWTTERDYLERSTDAALGAADDWLMANATTRRLAAVLEDMGVRVRYIDDELPRKTASTPLKLV